MYSDHVIKLVLGVTWGLVRAAKLQMYLLPLLFESMLLQQVIDIDFTIVILWQKLQSSHFLFSLNVK